MVTRKKPSFKKLMAAALMHYRSRIKQLEEVGCLLDVVCLSGRSSALFFLFYVMAESPAGT
jgi:hypothetical protein